MLSFPHVLPVPVLFLPHFVHLVLPDEGKEHHNHEEDQEEPHVLVKLDWLPIVNFLGELSLGHEVLFHD